MKRLLLFGFLGLLFCVGSLGELGATGDTTEVSIADGTITLAAAEEMLVGIDSVGLRSDSIYYLVLDLFSGINIRSIDESYTLTYGDVENAGTCFIFKKAGKTPLAIRISDWKAGKIYFSKTVVGSLWESTPQ